MRGYCPHNYNMGRQLAAIYSGVGIVRVDGMADAVVTDSEGGTSKEPAGLASVW